MTVDELIEILQDIENKHGPETEVRLAVQPSWPLSHHIENVRFLEGEERPSPSQPTAVWIAAAHGHPYDEVPYAPEEAWWDEE